MRYDKDLKELSLNELFLKNAYENSCYFCGAEGIIITVLRRPHQLVPYGVICREDDFEIIRNTKILSLEIAGENFVSLTLPAVSDISETTASFVRKKWKETCGDFAPHFEKILREKTYNKLVGLGPGLTPAGDDILVGLLAARALLGKERDFNIDYSRTTPLSGHFIKSAMAGKFSDNVIKFIESGDLSILKFGATSGVATALGILEGLREN
ncbi:MAG: hypothetical protein COT16_00005 [Elusimicrobia bacterium CG08_land_8_20_14_0_20_44_26]|nr:MAG: hypothetical protein COT16_00005 [Elusimicrobia bacterium CG08_land_8_20_14_0_20_44_26]